MDGRFGPVTQEVITLYHSGALPLLPYKAYALLVDTAMETDASLKADEALTGEPS